MDNSLSAPISFADLLQSKALEPLSRPAADELARVAALDVNGFSEAEVRAFVIDPIVRILGYGKGSIFSVDLERKIDFLEKDKFIDYKMTLWKENFWLIEAKRPRRGKSAFAYADLAQAVEYAIHPEVNAALVVLCDGEKLEVFDREASVTAPVLRVRRENLVTEFDKIRLLLEPWQIWFFQKRRIVRLLDKVFDKEFNLNRVAEFKGLIERRLDSKRVVILNNFRAQMRPEDDHTKTEQHLRQADDAELIDVHFFLNNPLPTTRVVIDALVARCNPSPFLILHRIFPDHPRDTSDLYYMHALWFLMTLHQSQPNPGGLPQWLAGPERKLDAAIETLIRLCLSSFADNESRKTIQLAAATFRRIFKILWLGREENWREGERLHALGRYMEPELSLAQIIGSPSGQILRRLNGATMMATSEFVREWTTERHGFLPESARSTLVSLWNHEKGLLASIPNYTRLRQERSLGELFPTEASNVTFDNLAHNCLCAIEYFSVWKAHTLARHRADVELAAAFGSWQARDWLGIDRMSIIPPPSDAIIADRFFFGDMETLRTLRGAYQ
jgi:Type I restriction enzyme R protein N terminus (HSDR_N)